MNHNQQPRPQLIRTNPHHDIDAQLKADIAEIVRNLDNRPMQREASSLVSAVAIALFIGTAAMLLQLFVDVLP